MRSHPHRAAAAPPIAPYRLLRTPPRPALPLVPDAAQQAVLAHPGGPLLVLAGPGTGKTTTLVEAVARRVEGGLRPEQVLVLTFSRKAAQELRERTAARLGEVGAPSTWTFHAFCYALLREHQDPDSYAEPLRLLSGPEQDVVLRDLLRGSLELGRSWPPALRACLGTRGLAEQVRSLWSRARELGLEPADLAALAAREGRDDWAALAAFFTEYLDVLDAQGTLDYAELVHRAVLLAERGDVLPVLRERYRAVFVDEYQDTDPAQERLLQALAGQGRDLVVVGDPDQSIYAFRGAEVQGLLEFPARFPQADGRPAPVLALRTCRRSGPALLEVSRSVARRLPAPGLPATQVRDHRDLQAAASVTGSVEVHTHPSAGAEADAVADLLRREYLERGTPWGRMAVLVRSGARSVPLLRRVLSAAGVPLEVAGDELPLAQEPAVAPLLLGLRVADALRAVEVAKAGVPLAGTGPAAAAVAGTGPAAAAPAGTGPAAAALARAQGRLAAELTAETARELLLSPLGGADAGQLRRLGRALRALDRATSGAADAPARLPAPSAQLLRDCLEDPRHLLTVDTEVARPAQRLAAVLARARTALARGDGPEAALWELWAASPWPDRLERLSLAGGAPARAADRDLDAVVALFAHVARASERRPLAGVAPLLDELQAQQIPGDVLAERGVRGDAVRMLTAHRSKGLEWDVVVVCSVQDGGWPDLRRRSSLLEPDRLAPRDALGLREPDDRAALLVDERRLLYVALTRARRRLVVTAVDSGEQDGERPSRFLDELGVVPTRHLDRVERPLSLPALVATLRREAVDPLRSVSHRRAAAGRLAVLAAARDDDGSPLVPAAHPDRWWGLALPTESERPVQPPGQPLQLSGTSLSGLGACPLQWFLAHEVHAEQATSTAMGFGGVLHALAHEVAQGRTVADLDVLVARLDRVWSQLAYDAPWQSTQQHDQARAALGRFLVWLGAERGRTQVDTEVRFEVDVQVPSGTVRLRGFLDRVELDGDGRVHVVDFKTGKSGPTARELEGHAQLGTYQLAVRHGALDGQLPDRPPVGGAELVMLRLDAGASGPAGAPKVQAQPVLAEDSSWVEELLETAVRRVLGESFPPTPHEGCDRCVFARCCPAQSGGRQVVS